MIEGIKEKAKVTKLSNLKKGKSRESNVTPSGKSADLIGEQLGISSSTVKRVDRLERETPQLLEAVAAGEISEKFCGPL